MEPIGGSAKGEQTMTKNTILRTFASKPFVVVDRDTNDVIGSSGNKAHARAFGASKVGENGYRIVDLSDVACFEQAALNAGDVAGAFVSGLALGRTTGEIAIRYYAHIDAPSVAAARRIVADRIHKAIGGLNREDARRQVAAWILEGACG